MAYTTIDDPSAHFQVTLYAGTDASTLEVTNGGNSDLQPDLIWIKNRSDTDTHRLFNSTTSTGGNGLSLNSDGSAAEASNSAGGYMNGFNTDGFDLTDGASNGDVVKNNGENYVAWQWKANGGSSTGSAAESGDNPAYNHQANTPAGFSIVTYTGTGDDDAQVTHGLGAVPDVIICKKRNDTGYWRSYFGKLHVSGYNRYLQIDQTNALTIDVGTWGNQNPTSSVFTLGQNTNLNADDDTYVAFCFVSIQGYSKFDGYTGNGNADGPFVYTGFKPAWVVVKKTSATHSWQTQYNSQGYNPVKYTIKLDTTDSDATENSMDFYSNGFKLRTTGNGHNTADGTYAYMAFAEQPFVTSGGVPCTGR